MQSFAGAYSPKQIVPMLDVKARPIIGTRRLMRKPVQFKALDALIRRKEMRKSLLNRLKNQKGFSMVELIAVLVIITVLAAIGVPVYLEQVKSARAADAQAAIGAIRTAAKMYQQKYGDMPRDIDELESKKMLNIEQSTKRNWSFTWDNALSTVTAVSTEDMPGGGGHELSYDAETGRWSGYGQ